MMNDPQRQSLNALLRVTQFRQLLLQRRLGERRHADRSLSPDNPRTTHEVRNRAEDYAILLLTPKHVAHGKRWTLIFIIILYIKYKHMGS